ncbi:MAG: hypothetical protein J0L75_06270 [Spirochaetes bacterium]|nr:hypothetical protein [Spirochaetota bacterium]
MHIAKEAQRPFFEGNYSLIDDDRGFVVGRYRLEYEDGSSHEIPLFLFHNITVYDAHPLQRYLYAARWVWTGATRALTARNPDDADLAVQQVEFANPRPQDKVRSISLIRAVSRAKVEVVPALLALTVERTK